MKCPYCHTDDDRVLDTRASEDGFAVRRRRSCSSCKRRFTTYERVERVRVRVVKKDGSTEPFDREKIRSGLEKACYKRSIGAERIEQIVAEVENYVDNLELNFETEVSSLQIGELVMQQLRELDQVAYVRFASVYRRFKDVHDFVDELKPMLAESPRAPGE